MGIFPTTLHVWLFFCLLPRRLDKQERWLCDSCTICYNKEENRSGRLPSALAFSLLFNPFAKSFCAPGWNPDLFKSWCLISWVSSLLLRSSPHIVNACFEEAKKRNINLLALSTLVFAFFSSHNSIFVPSRCPLLADKKFKFFVDFMQRNAQHTVERETGRKPEMWLWRGGRRKAFVRMLVKKSITNMPISIHHIANHLKPPNTINFFCSQINSLRARKLLASSPKWNSLPSEAREKFLFSFVLHLFAPFSTLIRVAPIKKIFKSWVVYRSRRKWIFIWKINWIIFLLFCCCVP